MCLPHLAFFGLPCLFFTIVMRTVTLMVSAFVWTTCIFGPLCVMLHSFASVMTSSEAASLEQNCETSCH